MFWAGSALLVSVWVYFRLPECKGRTYRELGTRARPCTTSPQIVCSNGAFPLASLRPPTSTPTRMLRWRLLASVTTCARRHILLQKFVLGRSNQNRWRQRKVRSRLVSAKASQPSCRRRVTLCDPYLGNDRAVNAIVCCPSTPSRARPSISGCQTLAPTREGRYVLRLHAYKHTHLPLGTGRCPRCPRTGYMWCRRSVTARSATQADSGPTRHGRVACSLHPRRSRHVYLGVPC